jgi:hypothetical protein
MRNMAIVDGSYAEARARLARDPIVRAMAVGLGREHRDTLVHPGGGPRHEFMMAANDEYRRRNGGRPAETAGLGDVAHALLAVLDSVPNPHETGWTPAEAQAYVRFLPAGVRLSEAPAGLIAQAVHAGRLADEAEDGRVQRAEADAEALDRIAGLLEGDFSPGMRDEIAEIVRRSGRKIEATP